MRARTIPVEELLGAGLLLGVGGDALLRAPGPPGLNLSLWIASVGMVVMTAMVAPPVVGCAP